MKNLIIASALAMLFAIPQDLQARMRHSKHGGPFRTECRAKVHRKAAPRIGMICYKVPHGGTFFHKNHRRYYRHGNLVYEIVESGKRITYILVRTIA